MSIAGIDAVAECLTGLTSVPHCSNDVWCMHGTYKADYTLNTSKRFLKTEHLRNKFHKMPATLR